VDKILLNSEVIVYLLSKSLMMLLLLVAFVYAIAILREWDFESFSPKQFALEDKSYLVSTIIVFALMLKVFLVFYFVHTIDALSEFVPGAMCAAGVIKANIYGNYLLSISIGTIFLSFLWMSINSLDLRLLNYPYMKIKALFFVILFLLLLVEFGLDWLYFTHINTQKAVSCCSVIYGKVGGGLPFGLDSAKLLILFYLLSVLILLSVWMEYIYIAIVSSVMFIFVGYYSVVYFFGTYIYELPTHKCPFCMLQHYYYYVGYLVWGLLFGGIFLLLDSLLMQVFFKQKSTRLKKVAIVMVISFVLLCSGYVVVYFIENGVFL
jgi:hypothetical protein